MVDKRIENIKPDLEKKILNLAGELSPVLKKVLEGFNCVLLEPSESNQTFDFIFTRDNGDGYKSLAAKYETCKRNIPIISLCEVGNKEEFFKANGRGWINEKLLTVDQYLETFERFFTHRSSIFLEDVYNNLQYKTEVIKLNSHFNVGYYMDLISIEMMKSGLDVVNFRKYFLNAITLMKYLHSSNVGRFPLDIDYMLKDNRLDLQIYCSVENFYLEYLYNAIKKDDRLNPLRGVLNQCFYNTDFLDIYYLKKATKLVLCASFLNNELLDKQENYFPSMLLNEIDTFKQFQIKEKERLINIRLKKDDSLDYAQFEHSKLPGEGISLQEEKRLRDDIPLFEKVIAHIKDLRGTEENPKDVLELAPDDVDTYLSTYSDQDEIDFVNLYDHDDIIAALINNIDYVLKQERGPKICGTDHIKDSFTRISGSKEQKESMFIIRGSKSENEKGNMRVTSLEGATSRDELHSNADQEMATSENVTEIVEKRMEQSKQLYEKKIQSLLRELEETRLQVRNTALDKAEIDKLTKENNDFKNSLETSMKRIEILSDKLDKAQGGKSGGHQGQMVKNEEDLNNADDALKKQYNKIKREWEERTIEVKRLELVNRQLEAEVKKLTSQLEKTAEVESDSKDSDAKMRAMDIELKNLKVEVGTKEKTLQALTQKNKALSDQLGRVIEESKTARPVDNGKLAKMENRMKQVDTANQNLTKERDALKKEVADKKKDVVTLQKENQTLRNQNQELERKLKVEKSKQAA